MKAIEEEVAKCVIVSVSVLEFHTGRGGVNEEEYVIKSVLLNDLVGDFRHLRKNTRSLIS